MTERNPAHPFKSPNFCSSLRYACRGLGQLIRQERNFQTHLVLAALALGAGWLLSLSRTEWVLLVLCMTLMLAVEALNTAVEYTVDRLMGDKQSPEAAVVKDVSAAACLITAVGVALAGVLIFLPHLRQRLEIG